MDGPNQTMFENREDAEISGNSVKWTFPILKISKLAHFQDIWLNSCIHRYAPNSVIFNVFEFFFSKFRKFCQLLGMFLFYYFTHFYLLKPQDSGFGDTHLFSIFCWKSIDCIFKTLYCRDRRQQRQTLCRQTLCLKRCRDRRQGFRKPSFLPWATNRENMASPRRHLRPTYQS